MHQLQILRDEFKIDQTAGGIFRNPTGLLSPFSLAMAVAHLDHVAGDLLGVARGAAVCPGSRPSTRAANSGDADTTRARVSAMCSHVQASVS